MKKSKAARSAARKPPASRAARTASARKHRDDGDAVALLKADHRKVEKLFATFAAADDSAEKRKLAAEICRELIVHTRLEEEIFYAACREAGVDDDSLDEAQVEHDGAKVVIADLLQGGPDTAYYDAKVTVLSEYIKHHVGEEEKPRTGIFARAKGAGLDMAEIGARLAARKAEIMDNDVAREPLQARALSLRNIHSTTEDFDMPRNSNRDRDDQGRFTSDDDDRSRQGRGSRSSNSGGYSTRSSRDYDDDDNGRGRSGGGGGNRERDEQGRFTSDDDDNGRGYGRQSRGYDDDDRGYGRGDGGNRERDDRGRFMSDDDDDDNRSRSRSSRSDRDDDDRQSSNRGGNRDRDDRGRFMSDDDDDDSNQGRSYQGRSSSRSGGQSRGNDRDRDDQGRFTSDDDGDRGYSRQSSGRGGRSNEDDDGRRSNRSGAQASGNRSSSRSQSHQGHGGWFGDHNGHAEAAKRGWQHRG
jgi:hypothetical protein